MGLGSEIGSLEAGKQADLVVVDLDKPHLQPFYGGYPALVFYAKASDVEVKKGEVAEAGSGRRLAPFLDFDKEFERIDFCIRK